MHIRSIRFKTTLLYSGILLGILLAYNSVLYFSLRSILVRDVDEELKIKAGEISNILLAYEKIKNTSLHPMSVLENLLQKHGVLPDRAVIVDDLWRSNFKTLKLKEDYINILNVSGRSLLHSNNVTPGIKDLISEQFGFSNNEVYCGTVEKRSLKVRVINLPFIYKHNLPLTIQVATPLRPVHQFLARFMMISSGCILGTIALTSFLGSFFVKHILRPVVAVTRTANDISHMDLAKRISMGDTDIELKQLIDSFNAMLERLEKSFIHINEFNSYVAHELKTPLAIVKGELELAIEQLKEKNENDTILSDCLEEIDRMIKIIKDLLFLAKIDYKPQILKFEKINFQKFFEEIIEHGTILASEKKIKLTADSLKLKETLTIDADKVHLRRLFLNIITNAIKYTPANGNIHLSVKREKDHLFFDISDTGEGISEENLQKIFDKFFRVDKEETTQNAGFGLGLSIALSIAKAHKGDIKVKSKFNEGTTFTVILPLST